MNITHNIFCHWQTIGDPNHKKYQCINCNKTIVVLDDYQDPPQIVCGHNIKLFGDNGDLSDNLKNFVSIDISKNNNLFCSKTKTDLRYSICQNCEFFHKHTCKKCGCAITRDQKFASKLILENEHCPIDKW